MNIFTTLLFTERRPESHYARILLILDAHQRRWNRPLDGVVKLAKLDFLVRYPTYLERALVRKGVAASNAHVTDQERGALESTMVHYRFGPWDERYLRWIRELEARGLVTIDRRLAAAQLSPSEKATNLARELAATEAMADVASRATIVTAKFDQSSKSLTDFLLSTFPEISTLHPGDSIPL